MSARRSRGSRESSLVGCGRAVFAAAAAPAGAAPTLIPTDEELAACPALGRELAEHLAGPRHVDLTAPLARIA